MKILIAGLGSVGRKHVNSILKIIPSAEIFAIRSKIDSENLHGVRNIYTLSEVSLHDFDFALISNPTSEHKNTISKLLEYNIPLFIEKPLYISLDVENMIHSVEKRSIMTYVACNLRFLDCMIYIRNTIVQNQNRKINELNVYCGSYLPEWRPNVDFRKVYSAIPELGGGVHIDLIHELDYLYWIFGMPIEVNRKFKRNSTLSITAIDYANYILDFGGFCASVVLNYYRRDNKRSFEVVFQDDTWNVDLLKNQITGKEGILFYSDQKISDTYDKQMEYFINCVKNKIQSFNTISDGYNVLKICLDENGTK